MPDENEYREERFRPPEGTFHPALNEVADKWVPPIVSSLGASHGLVLLTVERLVVGFGYRVRRLPVAKISKKSGLGRDRVGEILSDLEAAGVLVINGRGRGRKPFVGINLDWEPTREALEAGERVQSARTKRKHITEDELPTAVGNLENGELPTQDNNLIAYPGMQLPPKTLPTSVGNDLTTPVGNKKQIEKKGVSQGLTGSGFSSPESGLGSFERKKRNPTPPSSSSGNPVSNINKEVEDSLEKTDDDEKDKDFSESQVRVDNDTRRNGLTPSKRTAAKKSVKGLANEIETIPLENLSNEARELGESLREKIPRIETSKAMRLSQKCIETGNVEKLGNLVGRCKEKLRGAEVSNVYMYLVSSLGPLEDVGPDDTPLETFNEAYEAARPARTLGGRFAKTQHVGVARRDRIPTENYIERF